MASSLAGKIYETVWGRKERGEAGSYLDWEEGRRNPWRKLRLHLITSFNAIYEQNPRDNSCIEFLSLQDTCR